MRWTFVLSLGAVGCVGRLLGDDPGGDGGLDSETGAPGSVSASVGDSAPSDDEARPDDGEVGDVDDGVAEDDGTPTPDLPPAGCGEGELCLQEVSRTEVGGVPDDIEAVDLDEDGWLDLAVANSGSDDVSLLHGFGDGTFAEIALVPVCEAPRSVAAADFDLDGHADLAFACADAWTILILLGDGTGSFPSATVVDAPYAPVRIFANQIDGDGRPDLLLANYYGVSPPQAPSYSVMTQPTAMIFAESQHIDDDLHSNSGFPRLGDLDLDGDLDLVAGGIVAFGDGNGGFPDQEVLDDVNSDGEYALVDIDGDGVLDLAEPGGFTSGQTITFLAGAGDGSFVEAGGLDDIESPTLMEFGDLEGDGGRDFVTTGNSGLTAWRWDSGFSYAGPWTFDPTSDLRGLVVVDLNADGRDDVVVASGSKREVVVLLSTK